MHSKTQNSEILEALLRFKRTFQSIGAFTACVNMLMLMPSIYMMQVYDRVLASRNDFTLYMLTIMTVGLYAIVSSLEYVRGMMLVKTAGKLDDYLNKRVFSAAFEQNLKSSGINAGQFLNDLTTIRQFVTGNAVFTFFDAPWFPVYLIVIFIFNFWLGVFATISTFLLILLAWANEYATKKTLTEANSLAVKSSMIASNNLRNAEVIEAMGMLSSIRNRWFDVHKRFIDLQADASRKSAKINSLTRFVRITVQSLILGVAALLVIKGEVSAGMMIAASILLGRCISPVEQVIGVWKQWKGVQSSYKRLTDLLDSNPVRSEAMPLPAPKGRIIVESVTLVPPNGIAPILKNVSLELVSGDVMGLIGPSGSGKSSLARLLVGIWQPRVGNVRLDGADVYLWNKEELGPNLGYLPQDVELFSGTIAENIARFGEVESTKVIKASVMAGVHEMILKMPNGYDTEIGDSGMSLSGGQRQRIGLARALFGDPAFVVLDEPNSNLDDAGEVALAGAINNLKHENKTVVLISHRPSVLKLTNKLLVLRDGIVANFGTTNEVLGAIRERYSKLPEVKL